MSRVGRKPVYVSIDVEADGPIPGPYSLLQLGAAVFDLESTSPRIPLDRFRANLEELPGASQDPTTMAWWSKRPEAYAKTREDTESPQVVMERFVRWTASFGRRPVLVGYPVTYDFMFVYWYAMSFGGIASGDQPPFGFQGCCMKTIASELLGVPFNRVSKSVMPEIWFRGCPLHTHDACDDAVEQGVLFVNMKMSSRD